MSDTIIREEASSGPAVMNSNRAPRRGVFNDMASERRFTEVANKKEPNFKTGDTKAPNLTIRNGIRSLHDWAAWNALDDHRG